MPSIPPLTPPVSPPNPSVPATYETLAFPFMQWLYTHGNEMIATVDALNGIDYLSQPLLVEEDDMFQVPSTSGTKSYGAAINGGACVDSTVFPYGSVYIRSNSASNLNTGFYIRSIESSLSLSSGVKSYSTATIKTYSSLASTLMYIGLHDSTTISDPVNGCYFKIIAGVVTAVCANSSTRTASATMATLSVSTEYKFVIIADGVSSVTFNIYDSTNSLIASTTITTNLPAGTFSNCINATYALNSPTSQIIVYIDHIGYKVVSKNYITRW